MSFDPTKKCQTRDGRKVRILCTDAGGKYPIVGIIEGDEKAVVAKRWEATGFYHHNNSWPELDLINIPEKRKLTGWVNVYPHHFSASMPSKEIANQSSATWRIACLDLSKYNIEFTEGEGL